MEWQCSRCGAEVYVVVRVARGIGGAQLETRECRHCQHVTYGAPVEEQHKGVEYEPATPGGARCPSCGQQPAHTYRTLKVVSGVRVRYHACKYCGWRGKSTQKVG